MVVRCYTPNNNGAIFVLDRILNLLQYADEGRVISRYPVQFRA